MGLPSHQPKAEPQDNAVEQIAPASENSIAEKCLEETRGESSTTAISDMNGSSILSAQKTLDRDFGELNLFSKDGSDLNDDRAAEVFSTLGKGLHNLGERDFQALGKAFNTNAEAVQKLIESQLNGGLTQAEMDSRMSVAKAEIGQVQAAINAGTANLGDLGSLLNAYSGLNGFTAGALMQSSVGAQMNKVFASLAAAEANRNNPTGMTRAEVISHRISASDLERLRENA